MIYRALSGVLRRFSTSLEQLFTRASCFICLSCKIDAQDSVRETELRLTPPRVTAAFSRRDKRKFEPRYVAINPVIRAV